MKSTIKVLLKSFLFLFLFTIIIGYLLVRTPTGNKISYFMMSEKISQKARFDIKVLSVNFYQYPDFSAEFLLHDAYKLKINGVLSFATLDLDFALTSDCISSNICVIDDDIDIKGKLYGKFKDFTIKGEGKILDGTLSLNGLKKDKHFENINLILSDVNSSKFFTALDQKPLFTGKSNVQLHFDTLSKKDIQGQLTYQAKNNNFSNINTKVTLDSKIYIDNKKYTFTMDMSMPSVTVQVREGRYDQASKYATAKYTLDVTELGDIKKITKLNLRGPFYVNGDLKLDKKIKIKGVSKSFGGLLNIAYQKKKFHFDLENVPFSTLMQRLKQNPLLDAKMFGTIEYDTKEKEMHCKVQLTEVKFLQKELNTLVQEKFGHNLRQEIFPNSSFEANLKDDILSSTLKIANDTNYLIFKNTELNAIERSISTHINFQIQGHNIEGKLYARNDGHTRHTLDTYLTFDGLVENHYRLKLNGPLSKKWINMDYELSATRLPSHLVTIEDDINITGHLYGPYTRLYIRGEGTALNGKINFDGLKVYNELKDFSIKLSDIHANKLYTLIGIADLPHGKATVEAHFKYLNKENKKGTLNYSLRDAHYATLPLKFSTNINIDKNLYTFNADIDLNTAKTKITKGIYNEKEKSTHASYALEIKDLTKIEALLGHAYRGAFDAKGEIEYKDSLRIRGLSKSLGGTTDYLYKDEILYIDFNDTSLKAITTLLDYPTYLEASTNGSINYDFPKELLLVNTKLDNARFIKSDFVEDTYQKAGINLLYETFDASQLDVRYQNDIITGSVKLSNLKSHIYLTNAKINTKQKSVNAYFDVNIQNKKFTGKIYGSLDNPKINLDMQKLIQHEMDRQIDSMGGKTPRELMEGLPMGGVAKDVVTGTAGSFMGIFF